MDAKKVSAALATVVVAGSVITTASPEALALIEVGLIGLLYGLRRRRLALRVSH